MSHGTVAVTVERDVACVARDGTVLRSNVYRPADAGRYPVLLGRTPYGKETWGRWIEPERTAAEGWIVVINDMRGGFASDGEFRPFFHDADDGYDVVEWCGSQPWSNGRVGMFGSSAPGFMQLLAAAARPPSLVAIAPMQTWTSFGRGCVYDPGGAFMLYTAQWALMLEGMDPARRLDASAPGYLERLRAVQQAQWAPGEWLGAPSLRDHAHLARPYADFFHAWLDHPDHDDFWAPLDLDRQFERIDVPALHLVGLFDKFRLGSTRNYRALRERAASARAREGQRLVIGPWTHGIPVRAEASERFFGPETHVDVRALVLRWYERWLRGDGDAFDDAPPVRVWVQGAERWREAADWPLPGTRTTALHLRAGGRLSFDEPGEGEGADRFVHDPLVPAPTTPDPRQTRSEGPLDVRAISARDDVLHYETAPLDTDLEAIGEISVRLFAATSARDADWVVTLLDIAPDGRAERVTEGMLRARYRDGHAASALVEPGTVVEYEIVLRPSAVRFAAGHRIGLDIAGASFPQYDRNVGRGIAFDVELEDAVQTQTVFHDAGRPSALLLPLV
ncbi:CocE/NonD family hydrolase [Conexibacter stalactiti]|uniref:CocE/NonD family hydrolase n=1 Tax=Conexibacter stalactiti TaxID=1940611 RepID=A0ABU4HU95_9ACTN|nr:CocE/NonD family hydrolase [Conexibacter stalactiti]MDW5596890.1 CocE/NonD family hydrolase [Conexibacter stalactiti]MEC5037532.1 CocE/NonD family hydrolase [Conexibacter stalactiti]